MPDDTEVSQASIYRNLWIEAEASACKLKYELQQARMKLATEKGHNSTLNNIQMGLGYSVYAEIFLIYLNLLLMQFLTHWEAVKTPTHPYPVVNHKTMGKKALNALWPWRAREKILVTGILLL